MSYTDIVTEARTELVDGLATWDLGGGPGTAWATYFPADYDATLQKTVKLTTEWPSDQLLNIEGATQNGMMTVPIISVVSRDNRPVAPFDGGRLGNVMGPGPNGTTQYGRTRELEFQIDCWADLQVGQGEQAARLGGAVIDWAFMNLNSLSSLRRLDARGGRLFLNDAAQLWRYTLILTGRLVHGYTL